MDEIFTACHFCGVHWPESHITRWSDRTAEEVFDRHPMNRLGRAFGVNNEPYSPLPVPRYDVCCVCMDELKLTDDLTSLKEKRRILKIRNDLLESRRKRREGPDETVDWIPDLDPPAR